MSEGRVKRVKMEAPNALEMNSATYDVYKSLNKKCQRCMIFGAGGIVPNDNEIKEMIKNDCGGCKR